MRMLDYLGGRVILRNAKALVNRCTRGSTSAGAGFVSTSKEHITGSGGHGRHDRVVQHVANSPVCIAITSGISIGFVP